MKMAFFDSKKFLFSHIRHSFISCDDTGMCEAVMAGENLEQFGSTEVDAHDTDLSQSYDLISEMDIGAHRRRSNTAVRLERLKKERKNQMKTKNVQWSTYDQPFSAEDMNEMFQKKEVNRKIEVRKSLLSEQLASCPSQPNNAFNEFAKFDGNAHTGLPSKKILIFLTMMDEKQRSYPMEVVILNTARVQDLIGLICWQYVNQKKNPDLKDSADYYSLHIAEDDGEVDLDFPCLDPKDNITKFGFSVLAIVEKNSSRVDSSVIISVNIPNEGVKKMKLETKQISIQELLGKVIKMLSASTRLSHGYQEDFPCYSGVQQCHLENSSAPGAMLQSSAVLLDLNCQEFSLVSDSGCEAVEETEEWTLKNMTAMEAPLYQSFTVNLYHKLRSKSEVHLGISGEKVELDPVQQKSNKFWNRQQKQKPVSYDMSTIMACEILDIRYPGKAVFRLTLQSCDHEYKTHDFEADKQTANNIVEKMSHILEMHSSIARRDYLTSRERKSFRRPFSVGPR